MGDLYLVAALTEEAAQQLGLPFRMDTERGTFRHPHGGVFGSGFLGPQVEDDAVQNGPPDQAGNFDHAWIAEKFGEVAPQCGGGRCRRRAEIDQDDGRRVLRCRWCGFREVAGHGGQGFFWERADDSRRAVISTMGMTRS